MENFMEREFKINENIHKKIKEADLPNSIKEFIIQILDIEFREGKGNYSKSYQKAIDETAVKFIENDTTN